MSTTEAAPPKFAVTERMYEPGGVRQYHDYVATSGTSIEEILTPTYWQRVSSLLHIYDRIDVIEEAGAWFAELLVLSVGANGVQVGPLRGIKLDGMVGANGTATRNQTGATVKYRGPHLRWCVLDKSGEPLYEKCKTESDAYLWLNEYVKRVQK